MIIDCVAHVPGCPACAREPLRRPWPHVCDDTCAAQAANRSAPAGHERSHAARVHGCGAILDDRRGGSFEQVFVCGWGACVQYTCPGCGDVLGGFGPRGCPCDHAPHGAGTFHRAVTASSRRRLLDVLRARHR